MKEYLYELHAHTAEVSRCSRVDAATLVGLHRGAGYRGVVITDHFSRHTFAGMEQLSAEEKITHYLRGYRAAKALETPDFSVFFGMELTFYESDNDYLVYGAHEDFLFRHPDMMEMGLARFCAVAREEGVLLFQAHPFRVNMKLVKPALLDGIEVWNGNPRHNSSNDIALAWAEKYRLLRSSGSDFHQPEDLARGGISTNEPLADGAALAGALRAGASLLIPD